ncbi:selenium-dependent molybdenum cofactor biosynthesis protein YqeB [Veillonella sp. YH-vei2232]|uniref:Selenium-dependent molybdenum cofactor biosynthesis protein YqeB n=1 Tax=Veillonella absiana TaxID=3079305 RepID=A0ABU3Z6B5_9FIRM|nr:MULTISPECIES: selenium-dependent molybdenum cofactor biosynthesis protein YqeB [unclassified Veillonella]MDV5063440.1 selenium-dependent molybdenum cofactor biosynthesis protein YqeB [Veillonella sp. YH-vei2232]MDV5087450.1 selenium-dependent molybdenum cofactor biosynthesis protein YqeB [Veillonella sp. YH-vei2233]
MKPLVLVRSGGDIASGVIYRLKRAGYPVIVNEIAIPTMIRREVSYGNAVHRGEMVLERFVARHVSMIEAKNLINTDVIPVVTDAYLDVLQAFKPDVVVDGILAKVNKGTQAYDADLVIGLGPGFTAGVDVDVVIETMRGHRLGRCIYDGSAQPNTGIPGNVGGYTHERVIHSPAEGLFTAKRHIGDSVQANEVIGYVEDIPVRAKITGILRGILKNGLMVTEGFKLADVDARCEEFHCYSISDKSLAVGGGAMEAITAWEYQVEKDKQFC